MRKPKVETKVKATGFAAVVLGKASPPSLAPASVDLPIVIPPPPIIYIGMSIVTNVDLSKVIATEMEVIGEKEIKKVMGTMAAKLKNALNAAIKSSVWAWPSGGSRDIYDQGRLASSGNVTVEGSSLVVTYGAPYANLVHNGGYILPYGNPNARPVYLPGRPWVTSTIYGGGPVPKFNFGDELKKLA